MCSCYIATIDVLTYRNDLSMLLNKFGLKFDSRKDPSFHDSQGRITFETFKHCYCRPYPEEYSTSPPPRSGSGNRVQRQPLHPSHHSRNTLKYVGSPKGYGGYDCDGYPLEEQRRPSYSREHNRTPEVRGQQTEVEYVVSGIVVMM